MHSKEKKRALLHQLSQEADPIGFSALMSKLDNSYRERSVRRWLVEMIREGLVEKLGHKRGTRYRVVQRTSRPAGTNCFGSDSEKTLAQVRRPIFERQPVSYASAWFNDYEPNISFYLPSFLRSQLRQAGHRFSHDEPAGTYAHQIFNRLLIDLSYNSSRLEGNTYSLLDTEKLLLEGVSVEGKLYEEKVMILNHKEAIRYLVDSASKLEASKEVICTLHYLLSDGLVEARYAGKVRDHGVRIGGSTYIPFESQRELQMRLEYIATKALVIQDPYEQSFFLLVHLSYLQAFTDVNKRTARLSANIPLVRSNLVPVSFNDIERDDYSSAVIAIYEFQDIRPLLDLYVFSYMRTCAQYDSTVKALGFDYVRVRYRQTRREVIREIILDRLSGEEIKIRASDRARRLGVLQENRSDFIEDVLEDLKEMDQSRMAGLGITLEQLQIWLDAQKS